MTQILNGSEPDSTTPKKIVVGDRNGAISTQQRKSTARSDDVGVRQVGAVMQIRSHARVAEVDAGRPRRIEFYARCLQSELQAQPAASPLVGAYRKALLRSMGNLGNEELVSIALNGVPDK